MSQPHQLKLWPRHKKKSFAARRPPLADFRRTPAAQRLYRVIRDQLCYDQGLYSRPSGLRLEWVQLEYGLPHYRLYKGKLLIGVVDIHSTRKLDRTQRRLAAYLMAFGFHPDNVRVVRAYTPLNAEKWRVPHLF